MRYSWVVVTLAAVVGIALLLGRGGSGAPAPEQRNASGASTVDPFAGRSASSSVAPEPVAADVLPAEALSEAMLDATESVTETFADTRDSITAFTSGDDAAGELLAAEDSVVADPALDDSMIADAGAVAPEGTIALDVADVSAPALSESIDSETEGKADGSMDAEALRALKTTLAMEGRRLKGSGTVEDPFELTWDLLTAAHDTYRPKVGKKDLPAWAEAIAGSHVRVVGYVLFPMFASESDELLLMKNQWDGCCIGVPPTPYDAVEVKLASRSSAAGELVNYGTLRGTLRVDPYVVNDWLLSLYVLEDARLESIGLQGDVEAAGHIGPARGSAPAAGSGPMGR